MRVYGTPQNTCFIGGECRLVANNVGQHMVGPTPPGASLQVDQVPMRIGPPVPATQLRPTITAWTDTFIAFTFSSPPPAGRYRLTVHAGKAVSNTLEITLAPAPTGADADGDGVRSIAAGGTDCNDFDPRQRPGAAEVADAEDLDEDCNPDTFGARDGDRDGVPDARACNVRVVGAGLDRALEYHCGSDCDDANAAVIPGAMTCDGRDPSLIFVCRPRAAVTGADPRRSATQSFFDPYYCRSFVPEGRCVSMPNGTGDCR